MKALPEDAETIRSWFRSAIEQAKRDPRLRLEGDNLTFEKVLIWSVQLEADGRWFANYNCNVASEQYEPQAPLWSRHKKLRSEVELGKHVVDVIAAWDASTK